MHVIPGVELRLAGIFDSLLQRSTMLKAFAVVCRGLPSDIHISARFVSDTCFNSKSLPLKLATWQRGSNQFNLVVILIINLMANASSACGSILISSMFNMQMVLAACRRSAWRGAFSPARGLQHS